MNRTAVVLPTYCEALNIVRFLEALHRVVPEADIIVVDDSSPDGTAELARAVGDTSGKVAVLVRPVKDGLGGAYRTGFGEALRLGYDWIVQMDADFSHAPEAVPTLLDRLLLGADVAIGSRYVEHGCIPNWTWHRRALSRYGNSYARLQLRTGIADATSGFRAFSAAALRRAEPATTRAAGYGIQIELLRRFVRQGLTVVEVPITFRDRTFGRSKMSVRIALEQLVLVTWWGLVDRLHPRTAGTATVDSPRTRTRV